MLTTTDDVQALLASAKFREWPLDLNLCVLMKATDKHYSPAELSEAWGVSPEKKSRKSPKTQRLAYPEEVHVNSSVFNSE